MGYLFAAAQPAPCMTHRTKSSTISAIRLYRPPPPPTPQPLLYNQAPLTLGDNLSSIHPHLHRDSHLPKPKLTFFCFGLGFFSNIFGSFLFPFQLFFFFFNLGFQPQNRYPPHHRRHHPNLPCQSPPSVPFRCLKTDTHTGRRARTAAPHLFEIHIKGYTSLSHAAQLPAHEHTHAKANTLSLSQTDTRAQLCPLK